MESDLTARIVLFAVMTGAGLLLLWMASAAASGRLKRNSFAGIRLPSTMASDEAWLAAHVRAKRPTMYAGYASLACALFVLLPVPALGLAIGILAGSCAMVGFTLYGARVGSRAATQIGRTTVD